MKRLALDEHFYATGDAAFRAGELFHVEYNRSGGSNATPIGRFFVTEPDIGAEGFHPHQRLDCFVRDHDLAPPADRLGKLLADALMAADIVREPLWVGWHQATELGGEARGEVFDYED